MDKQQIETLKKHLDLIMEDGKIYASCIYNSEANKPYCINIANTNNDFFAYMIVTSYMIVKLLETMQDKMNETINNNNFTDTIAFVTDNTSIEKTATLQNIRKNISCGVLNVESQLKSFKETFNKYIENALESVKE